MSDNPIIRIIDEVYAEAKQSCYDFDMVEGMNVLHDMLLEKFSKVRVREHGEKRFSGKYTET